MKPSTQEGLQLNRIEKLLRELNANVVQLTQELKQHNADHEKLEAHVNRFVDPAMHLTDKVHQVGKLAAQGYGAITTQAQVLANLLAAMRDLERTANGVLALSEGFDRDQVRAAVKV